MATNVRSTLRLAAELRMPDHTNVGVPYAESGRFSPMTISDISRGMPVEPHQIIPNDIIPGSKRKTVIWPTPDSDFMLRVFDREVQVQLASGNRVPDRGIWQWITLPSRAYVALVNPDEETIVMVNRLIPATHGPAVMLPSVEVPNNAGYVQLSLAASYVLGLIGADPLKAKLTEDHLRVHFAPAKSPVAHNILFAETREKLPDDGWVKPVPIASAINAIYSGGITSPYTQIASFLAGVTYVNKPRKYSPATETPRGANDIFAPDDPYVFGNHELLSGQKLAVTQSKQLGKAFAFNVVSERLKHDTDRRFHINTLTKAPSASLTVLNTIDGAPYLLTREEYRPGVLIEDPKVAPRRMFAGTTQNRPGAGYRFTENLSGALQMVADKSRLETPVEGAVREAIEEVHKTKLDRTEFDIRNTLIDLIATLDQMRAGIITDEHSMVGWSDAIWNELAEGRLDREAIRRPQMQLVRYGEEAPQYREIMSVLRGLDAMEMTKLVEPRVLTHAFLEESGVSTYEEYQNLLRGTGVMVKLY